MYSLRGRSPRGPVRSTEKLTDKNPNQDEQIYAEGHTGPATSERQLAELSLVELNPVENALFSLVNQSPKNGGTNIIFTRAGTGIRNNAIPPFLVETGARVAFDVSAGAKIDRMTPRERCDTAE